MDENVPVHTNAPVSMGRNAGVPSHGVQHHGKLRKFKMKHIAIITGAVLTLAVSLLGGFFLYQSSTSASINGGQYQAVFFTNGQVYFGKLQTLNGGYMKLTDIFYLQTQTAASSTTKNLQDTSNQTSSDVQLIKLGNEIHGPNDEMIINKDQILFFENLKKDGKVAESIAKYKSTTTVK